MIKAFCIGLVIGACLGAFAVVTWALIEVSKMHGNYDSDSEQEKAVANYKNSKKGGMNSGNKAEEPEDYEG